MFIIRRPREVKYFFVKNIRRGYRYILTNTNISIQSLKCIHTSLFKTKGMIIITHSHREIGKQFQLAEIMFRGRSCYRESVSMIRKSRRSFQIQCSLFIPNPFIKKKHEYQNISLRIPGGGGVNTLTIRSVFNFDTCLAKNYYQY